MLAFKSLKPLANRVVIKKVIAETKTKSGIILTSAQKGNELNQGTVLEVGPGAKLENGSIRPMDVKVGDVVLLPEYGGSRVTLAGENEVYIYRDDDIIGTLHDPSK
jgi:chaperonin GroES